MGKVSSPGFLYSEGRGNAEAESVREGAYHEAVSAQQASSLTVHCMGLGGEGSYSSTTREWHHSTFQGGFHIEPTCFQVGGFEEAGQRARECIMTLWFYS